MESADTSQFFDSILQQPVTTNSLSESIFEQPANSNHSPNSCSTPNVSLSLLENRKLLKRKYPIQCDIACKLEKVSSVDVSFDESLEITVVEQKNDAQFPEQTREVDKVKTLPLQNEFKENNIDVSKCNKNENDMELLSNKPKNTFEKCTNKLFQSTPTCQKTKDDSPLKFNETFGFLFSDAKNCNKENDGTRHSSPLDIVVSLGLEDDCLLISSSDEENDDKDIESYYHLLDSPHSSNHDEDESTLKDDTVIYNVTDNCNANKNDSLDSTLNSNHDKSDNTLKNDTVVNNVDKCNPDKSNSPDTNKEFSQSIKESSSSSSFDFSNDSYNSDSNKITQLNTRSHKLKPFMQHFKNSQQIPYPTWLEKAKKTCNFQEIDCLMDTVYDPASGYFLENLTIKNYRKSLQYVGINPDKFASHVKSSNFYFNEPSGNYKRFGIK